jgi:hypothetical protein
MLAATCGQAMLTTDGALLQPEGDSFTDRLAYLQQAAACLHQLPRSAHGRGPEYLGPTGPPGPPQARPNPHWQVGLAEVAPPTHEGRAR